MIVTMSMSIVMMVRTLDGFVEACSEVKACEPRMPHHILCAASLIACRDRGIGMGGENREEEQRGHRRE